MRKIRLLSTLLILVLSLCACSSNEKSQESSSSPVADAGESSLTDIEQDHDISEEAISEETSIAEEESSEDTIPPDDTANNTVDEDSAQTVTEPETMIFGGYYGYKEGLDDTSLEDIEWYILAEEDGKMLLCSKEAIFFNKYYDSYAAITWENSDIRAKLNDTFYNTAFTEEEKQRICTTTVVNTDNPVTGTDGGNDTEDKVFLLSTEEVDQYFTSPTAKKCIAWEYTWDLNSIKTYGEEHVCDWWLRSVGEEPEFAKCISHNENAVDAQSSVNSVIGIRPAIWITIK